MSSKKAGRPNYVFFGTPDFAAIILDKLIKAGLLPAAVVCNPDRPAGRKKIVTPPPAKVLAEEHKIKVYQPESLEIRNSLPIGKAGKLELGDIDFGVVASYGKIIPENIIRTFKLGAIGVHPSLLPRHRGASPIQSAILAGDEVTGVTLYLLDEKMDQGAIITGQELTITNDDNYETLSRRLANLGAELLIETLPKFARGEIRPQVQNEDYATYTGKFKTEDGFVDPEDLRAAQDGASLEKDDPVVIERKIRALNPEPGVWTLKEGKRMKILEAEIRDGKLKLKKIQFEGKKPQTC